MWARRASGRICCRNSCGGKFEEPVCAFAREKTRTRPRMAKIDLDSKNEPPEKVIYSNFFW